MKCGVVTITGRPNAGKSSLINALLRTNAMIVSPKPQTTRNAVRCIYNDDDAQIIFTDTPGLYTPDSHDKLGIFLNDSILDALEDSDCVLWLVDAGTRKLKPDDYETARAIPRKTPVIIAANKSDKADPVPALKLYGELLPSAERVAISAKARRGLDALIAAIMPHIPEGEPVYDPDILMDTTEKFMASEIIREKVLMLLRDEVPHCVAVVVDEYKSPEEYPDRKKLYIRATLVTETEGQKKIVIGSGGEMVRKIGELSRRAIEEVTGQGVYLDLWVKVVPGWRRNPAALRRLGYA
ncbi:MAG: GTPase Era [Synergistaceae bacterium]|nr:GTPase Era [Synergistaceae bacterium]MBQ7169580.1 GTPase Era [Synergistaceae bacterium]